MQLDKNRLTAILFSDFKIIHLGKDFYFKNGNNITKIEYKQKIHNIILLEAKKLGFNISYSEVLEVIFLLGVKTIAEHGENLDNFIMRKSESSIKNIIKHWVYGNHIIKIKDGLIISPKNLYGIFKQYQEIMKEDIISKYNFYKYIQELGFKKVRIEGYEFFKGIGINAKEDNNNNDNNNTFINT